MAQDGTTRRRVILALAATAAAAGTFSLYRERWFMPSDRWDELDDPESSLLSWPAAFGYTLLPLETAEEFALWDDVWADLPAEKEQWIERFSEVVDAHPIKENLRRFEIAVIWTLEGSPQFVDFLDTVYAEVFSRDYFVELGYVDGTYRVGEADPYTLAEWGVPVPGLTDDLA